jgi:ubiquinone/menaquinone biosynthesis C-methylase UbiE
MPNAATKQRANRRHFDRWARHYESDRVSRRLAVLQRSALAALELRAGDRLLDVGCGTGAAVRAAAAVAERAVGVDQSAAMIARGRELAAGLANLELLQADAEALPFDAGAFSAVLCTTSLHHYLHADRAVAEMARVLAPGGRVVIGDAVTDRRLVWLADQVLRRVQRSHVGLRRTSELEALMLGAGFERPRRRLLMDDVYAIVSATRPPACPGQGLPARV